MANKYNECNFVFWIIHIFYKIRTAIESLLLFDMDFSASKIEVYLKYV